MNPHRKRYKELSALLRRHEQEAGHGWLAAQPLSGLSKTEWDRVCSQVGRRLTWQLWQIALFEASNALRQQDREMLAFMAQVNPALYAVTSADSDEQAAFEQAWTTLRAG